MRIKNVTNPCAPGTTIFPGEVPPEETEENLSSQSESPASASKRANLMVANGYHGHEQKRRSPTAVTSKSDIVVVNLECHRNSKSSGFLRTMFDQLERYDVTLDLVTLSKMSISVAVEASQYMDPIRELAEEMESAGKVCRDSFLMCISLTEYAGSRLNIGEYVHHLHHWPQDEKHGRRGSGGVQCFGC